MDVVFTICDQHPLFSDSTEYVSNVKTHMATLSVDHQSWPITVNNTEYANALICSPYTTYVTFPLSEFNQFKKIWKKILLVINFSVNFFLYRFTQINRVVQVNNNLNSLIRHPALFSNHLFSLTEKLIQQYPAHAITFFRVNELLDTPFLKTLKNAGYIVFPDRPVHVFLLNTNYMNRSHTKRDLSLLKKTNYEILSHNQLTEQNAIRFEKLYHQLFIEKHSHLNPIYTEKYFRSAIKNHWHTYVALKNQQGEIDAFISWFISDNVMTCGPLGYDIEVDRKTGLYRQLVAICLDYANRNQFIFNMGGGSDEFKNNRGSTTTWEYTAVYCNHLPYYRHVPWKILQWACNQFIQKIMK